MSRESTRSGAWQFEREALDETRVHRYRLTRDGQPVSVREVVSFWQTNSAFVSDFSNELANSPFEAVRWETPPISRQTLERPFEFVLVDSPSLDRSPDPSSFAGSLGRGEEPVVSFWNLGGDARLVVPRPLTGVEPYAHLASFLRAAPAETLRALWAEVGRATEAEVGEEPRWLSTAGMGVPWLHVRLDRRPKYYHHAPYRRT